MNNNRQTAIVVILIIAAFVAGIFYGYKLTEYGNEPVSGTEASRNSTSSSSSETPPSSSITASEETSVSESEESLPEDSFNYLAIGNSITRHGIRDFWWNNIGMAASDAQHDYYHLVLKYLEDKYGNVTGGICNFSVWEVQAEDRDGTLTEFLEPFLNPDLDLITVQLGENVDDLETYQEDYVSMLKFIRSKAPNARILVIEDFWTVDDRYDMEFAACALTDAEFVPLDGIASNDEYYCGTGTTVYDEYGNEYTVEHEGVAMHPGDEGMAAIAERIISTLESGT